MNKGALSSGFAYFLWGLLPIYWKLLHRVPSMEILFHRMVWAFLFCVVLLTVRKDWAWTNKLIKNPKQLLVSFVSAIILSMNWLIYIWAINHGFIVEASLGYFINPLINILLGVIFLKERLRSFQTAAILLATVGVFYLTIMYGSFPWIALSLAFSFGFYGLVRKTAPLESIEGLCVETGFQSIPAIVFLIFWQGNGSASFINVDAQTTILLFCSGAATALPLIFFAAGARKITMTTLGLLQYIAPTLQFLIGVLVYGEAFSGDRIIGFAIIWIALVFYTVESVISANKKPIV